MFAGVISDNAYINSLLQRLESFQHKALLAITSAIESSFAEKLYQELGLGCPLKVAKVLLFFHKTVGDQPPSNFLVYFLQATIHTRKKWSKIGNS